MYSFAQRFDTQVVDEPFYAYYLSTTGIDHPSSEEILASQPTSSNEVINAIEELQEKKELVFVKNMAHHLVGLDTTFLHAWKNVFLIRNPRNLITSFSKVISKPSMNDIGILRQLEFYQELSIAGSCPVIDSESILQDPRAALYELCESIGIVFDKSMLSWQSGAIAEDGIWAKHWYANVHASSGFEQNQKTPSPFPEHCLSLLHESEKYYKIMLKNAITP